MILLDDLEFGYAGTDFRLRIDRLAVDAEEKVALVGPSGSGKTSLLHVLAGILTAERGTVRVGETRLDQLGDAARRDFRIQSVGLVFQEFELVDYLSVRDNILLPYFINRRQTLTSEVRDRVSELAETLGLADKLRRPIRKLSHGERQRVAIGRALLPQPELILADEPTGNLDPTTKEQVLELLIEQTSACRATLMVVTHDHSLLDRFDRVIDFNQFAGVAS